MIKKGRVGVRVWRTVKATDEFAKGGQIKLKPDKLEERVREVHVREMRGRNIRPNKSTDTSFGAK